MNARITCRSVDEYLAGQPAAARSVLQRVRAAIRKALPGAVEGISYQMPVYKLDGRMVLYFAGYRQHYSIYPATARLVAALEHELSGFLHSKATIRLSYADPIPTRLITRIATLRAAEVKAATVASDARRSASRRTKTAARKTPAKRRAKSR